MQNVQSIYMLYGAKSRTILLTLSCCLAHSSSYDVATKFYKLLYNLHKVYNHCCWSKLCTQSLKKQTMLVVRCKEVRMWCSNIFTVMVDSLTASVVISIDVLVSRLGFVISSTSWRWSRSVSLTEASISKVCADENLSDYKASSKFTSAVMCTCSSATIHITADHENTAQRWNFNS